MGDGEERDDSEWGEPVVEGTGQAPRPGDVVLTPGGRLVGEPLVGEDVDSPLDEDEPEGIIPHSPLWAMKSQRHGQWHLLGREHDRIRAKVGDGDDAVYAMDDGPHHVTLGHRVGVSPSGCQYSLVGRVPLRQFEELQSGQRAPAHAFDGAAELTLCGTSEESDVLTANVFDVDRYDTVDQIPLEFFPGAPFQEFPTDLDISVD